MRAASSKLAIFVVGLVALALSGLVYAAETTPNTALIATGASDQGSPFVNALYTTGTNGPKFELAHWFRPFFRSYGYVPYYSYTYYPSSYYVYPYAYSYPYFRRRHFRHFRHFRRY